MAVRDARARASPSGRDQRPECVSCRPTTRSSARRGRVAVGVDQRRRAARRDRRPRPASITSWCGLARPSGRTADRLAAPDQLGAALAEAPPAPAHEVGRAPVGGAVPALHRQHREAVADLAAADRRSAGPADRAGSTSSSRGRSAPTLAHGRAARRRCGACGPAPPPERPPAPWRGTLPSRPARVAAGGARRRHMGGRVPAESSLRRRSTGGRQCAELYPSPPSCWWAVTAVAGRPTSKPGSGNGFVAVAGVGDPPGRLPALRHRAARPGLAGQRARPPGPGRARPVVPVRRAASIRPADFAATFAKIDDFGDTSDFDLLYLMTLWNGHRDQLTPELRAAIEQRFVGFKYWYTDPQPAGVVDDQWFWSENHRLIFHVAGVPGRPGVPRPDVRERRQHRRRAPRPRRPRAHRHLARREGALRVHRVALRRLLPEGHRRRC